MARFFGTSNGRDHAFLEASIAQRPDLVRMALADDHLGRLQVEFNSPLDIGSFLHCGCDAGRCHLRLAAVALGLSLARSVPARHL